MERKYSGFFCVIEGLDGSGKTTIVDRLKRDDDFLDNIRKDCRNFLEYIVLSVSFTLRGFKLPNNVFITHEPGGTECGEELRTLLKTTSMSHEAEVGLCVLSRILLNNSLIIPALESGNIVISDRYTLSMAAYQELDSLEQAEKINKNLSNGKIIEPDLYIYIDVSDEVIKERISSRPGETDRFDTDSHVKRREIYNKAAKTHDNIVCIDGNASPDDVYNAVTDKIRKMYFKHFAKQVIDHIH